MTRTTLQVLPLDITLTATAPIAAPEGFLGAFARGVLLGALEYRGCACYAPTRQGVGSHHAPCPLHYLLGETAMGVRRMALTGVRLEGAVLRTRLLLYGEAVGYADVVADALAALEDHGIGRGAKGEGAGGGGGRLPLERVLIMRPFSDGVATSAPIVVYDSADGWMRYASDPIALVAPWTRTSLTPACEVGVERGLTITTPLDLGWSEAGVSEDGARVANPESLLSLSGIGRAVVRRWLALAEGRVSEVRNVHEFAAVGEDWVQTLGTMSARIEHLVWVHSGRHSARQRRRMPLAGVQGVITVVPADAAQASVIDALGDVLPLLPIGSRTAFGFGNLELKPARYRIAP